MANMATQIKQQYQVVYPNFIQIGRLETNEMSQWVFSSNAKL